MESRATVVSDCAAIVNIFRDHHFAKTLPEAPALAIQRGLDNECLNYATSKIIATTSPTSTLTTRAF